MNAVDHMVKATIQHLMEGGPLGPLEPWAMGMSSRIRETLQAIYSYEEEGKNYFHSLAVAGGMIVAKTIMMSPGTRRPKRRAMFWAIVSAMTICEEWEEEIAEIPLVLTMIHQAAAPATILMLNAHKHGWSKVRRAILKQRPNHPTFHQLLLTSGGNP